MPVFTECSNNTNKLSPQELAFRRNYKRRCSNNTNKLSPQEPFSFSTSCTICSNNTNKLSPQEPKIRVMQVLIVQIIQINLVLKNGCR